MTKTRKGIAVVAPANKGARYVYVDSESEEISPPTSQRARTSSSETSIPVNKFEDAYGRGRADPADTRDRLNLSRRPKPAREPLRQPCQALPTVEQSKTLAKALFPDTDHHHDTLPTTDVLESKALEYKKAAGRYILRPTQNVQAHRPPPAHDIGGGTAIIDASLTRHTQDPIPEPNGIQKRQKSRAKHSSPKKDLEDLEEVEDMASGGAYIPTNQQRNMRACMVCSIVRTQQQFMQQGCPNCEDILELIGNPEQINDCTSQVFDGLIAVADTKRSWVARYQRLEGYVPGVYATQVEGILPEEVIGAVESAGINYVPRDGSEQEMLPKD